MKALILVLVSLSSTAAMADAIGIYFAGGSTFQFVKGSSYYVSDRVSGRSGAQWRNGGCCAGGVSGYFSGRRFNWGTACAASRQQARDAAAQACESVYPYYSCDYSMQTMCD